LSTIAKDDRIRYQHQTILTFNCFLINCIESNANVSIYDRIRKANINNKKYDCFRWIIKKNKRTFNRVRLDRCSIKDEILLYRNKLWVPRNLDLFVKLIQEVYDQFFSKHFKIHRIIDLLRRNYYWPYMRRAMKQYIRNCYSCQRSKTSRDKYNEQLILVAISTQRWTNISMNFIIGLLEFNQKNAICIVIDKLTRKQHYIVCIVIDKNIFAKATTNIFLHDVFKYYDLFILIIFNREP